MRLYLSMALLLSIIGCELLSKNANLQPKTLETLESNIDDGQKQALAFFQESLQDNKHLDALKQAQSALLKDIKDKPQKTLNFKYNKTKLEQLFRKLGNDKTKQFLKNLHVTIKFINNGSFQSFSSANFNDLDTLEKKQERAINSIKEELYVNYYLYTNELVDLDYFFYRAMNYLS
ncbi:hypothetical protein ACE4V3_05305 (plasmid) [Borrelia recurrentis]|uniref:Complement regulators and plasminogen binding protein A n=1 Tax=Borrelia recurrentis TaxID=44449 RepID=C1L349_9SPIR|nr:human complement regulators and plasminogen binding protein A precursor [Borrelia recurrentis A1]